LLSYRDLQTAGAILGEKLRVVRMRSAKDRNDLREGGISSSAPILSRRGSSQQLRALGDCCDRPMLGHEAVKSFILDKNALEWSAADNLLR